MSDRFLKLGTAENPVFRLPWKLPGLPPDEVQAIARFWSRIEAVAKGIARADAVTLSPEGTAAFRRVEETAGHDRERGVRSDRQKPRGRQSGRKAGDERTETDR